MKKNNLGLCFVFLITVISLSPTLTYAKVTTEQVKQVMFDRSIPTWKNLAQKSQQVIDNPPNHQSKDLWHSLDEIEKSSIKTALEVASNASSTEELYGNITWLQNKILTKNADGRYSYVYAYDLNTINLSPKEAAIFFYHARIALSIDGARCVDRASTDNIINAYENQPSLKPLIDMVNKLPLKQQAIARLEAIGIEEMRGEREPINLMCNQGSRAMLRAIEQGATPQKIDSKSVNNGMINNVGNTYGVDTSGVKEELIPINEWQKKRREILDKILIDATNAL